ncbi:MAG: B12-binding domain-containing radical SAM protein, partial [Candidatus Bathyarchaeota archaeon]|nr:B12-binding domain-containing radical SAM protein [Candidatus Bathyarchaeota archaeon]
MPFRRVLLVKPSGRSGLSFLMDQIPIGLEYIAAYIEDAVEEVNIVDVEMDRRSFRQLLDLYLPDLLGITMSATEHNEGLRLAKIAKKRGIATVVGGYHPTAVPDLMLSYPQLDMVVRGEGEVTTRELVEKGTPEGVLGVSYKEDSRIIHNDDRPFITDLDSLPFPARHLRQYSYKGNDRKVDYDVLLTSRGCYGRCTFCCEPSMSQGRFRWRSPENVVEEILEIARYHEGRKVSVILADPDFVAKPARVERICDLMREHDLNMEFCGLVRTDTMARNPELVKKMCEVGILYFEMGIESPNPRDLNSTRKGITTKIHRQAVQNIRENGGGAGGTFVVGLPDQTEEEIKRFPVYAREIGMTAAAFGIVTPFPGTEFYKELDEKGLIFETNWDNFDEMHNVYKTKYLSKDKVEELTTYCMAKFWNIDTFIDREKVFQKRTNKKKPLIDFILERAMDLHFMGNAGASLKKKEFGRYVRVFLEAYPDPRVEAYTRKVGVHNVLEMTRFLRLLGPQTIQCT